MIGGSTVQCKDPGRLGVGGVAHRSRAPGWRWRRTRGGEENLPVR